MKRNRDGVRGGVERVVRVGAREGDVAGRWDVIRVITARV